jgi:N-acetylmuramic acid 6-phosphate etherase/N-acetylglucosamine-6-phosphate deacetylase
MIISAPRLFVDGAFRGPGAVRVLGGRVAEVLAGPGPADVALESGFLAPGLIDLHNNGAFGVDFATASAAEFADCVERLAACGVTSVLPTVITAPVEALLAAARRVAAAMAVHPEILGMHLEGPFLAAEKRGAHRAEWLLAPAAEYLDLLLGDAAVGRALRVMTLAPELPGGMAAIGRLAAAGVVVSLGHTAADAACVRAAVTAGASMVTHVFNAQSGLGHRAPGAPGVALTDERLWPCLIADGAHVDPAVLALAFRGCERAIAVTDSVLVAGLAAGAVGVFGGASVALRADGVARREDGTLAGAGITLDEGVRRLIAAGVAPETALAAATSRPAAALGLADRGRIAMGARADLVWFGDDFVVRQVWRGGVAGPAAVLLQGTERARAELADLDERGTLDIVRTFLAQERAAQLALGTEAGALAALADAVAARLAAGGRLFYAGAGTSGRLALLDAVECGPTFGVPEGLIVPILAGGDAAFLRAVEGAEDSAAAAESALAAAGFGPGDVLVGIAASGATPFTLGAVRYARAAGGLAGAIVNNAGGPIAAAAEIAVTIVSGAEVIAGSTRLSAGTVQKIALNVLSSTVMIRLGKVFGPHMVDMRATNAKLRRRAIRMVVAIAGCDEAAAAAALTAADMHVKTAVLVARGMEACEARALLEQASGSLRRALASHARDAMIVP